MTLFLRHMTSASKVTDFKGNIFGRAIHPTNASLIAKA